MPALPNPGLYDHVFRKLLGLQTAEVIVALYARALRRLARAPSDERVLDLGAGNGIGGALLADLGMGRVIALEIEPAARAAAERDHPASTATTWSATSRRMGPSGRTCATAISLLWSRCHPSAKTLSPAPC